MPDKIPDRSTLNEEDFKAMMERIEASNAGQEKYAKKQYRMSQILSLIHIAAVWTSPICRSTSVSGGSAVCTRIRPEEPVRI